MVKKNPRFRHRFGFSGNPEEKSEDPVTGDDIVHSLTRQYKSPGQGVEPTEALEQTSQPFESDEHGGSTRHRRSRLWIAPLSLLSATAALWLSGLLPGSVVNTGDTGIDYLLAKAASLGPILLGEATVILLVIIILGKRGRHGSSHRTDGSR